MRYLTCGIIVLFVLAVAGMLAFAYLRTMGCSYRTLGPAADFRALRDGYSFRNPIDTVTADDWDVWKTVFGDDKASSWAAFQAQSSGGKGVFSGGLCYGVVGTALSMYNRWLSAGDVPQDPKAQTVYQISSGTGSLDIGSGSAGIRDFLERYWLAQLVTSVDDATVDDDAGGTYRFIRAALENEDKELPILIIRTDSEHDGGPAGHAILPVGIDDPDAQGLARILVWDPNHPGSLRWLQISTETWEWSYLLFDGTKETWTSRAGRLGYVAISTVADALGKTPGGAGVVAKSGGASKAGVDLVPLTVTAGADAVFRGAGGGVLGFVDGRLRDSLAGAHYVYPDPVGGRSRVDRFVVPTGDGVRRTVTARTQSGYTYAVVTPTGGALVSGDPGRGETDALAVESGAAGVTLTPHRRERDCSVSVVPFVDGQARVMQVRPATLRRGESFTVAVTPDRAGVRVTNTGHARTYTVNLSSWGEPGGFESGKLSIGAGATQIITAGDWSGIAGSQVTLTGGGAGGTGATVLRQGTTTSPGGRSVPGWVLWAAVAVAVSAAVGAFLLLTRRRRREV